MGPPVGGAGRNVAGSCGRGRDCTVRASGGPTEPAVFRSPGGGKGLDKESPAATTSPSPCCVSILPRCSALSRQLRCLAQKVEEFEVCRREYALDERPQGVAVS